MKTKDFKELYNQSLPELKKQVDALTVQINKIQIDLSVGKIKNTNLRGSKKKDIARLKTVIQIKEQTKS